MEIRAELVGQVRVPGDPASDDVREVHTWPGRRLVTVRGDTALLAYDLDRLLVGDTAPAARFPAPWPRRAGGGDTVSPRLDLAVFAGQHALMAMEPDGTTRWQVRHSCWTGTCLSQHHSYQEYADDRAHRYPDNGSARFTGDGTMVWAHVRGPLATRTWRLDPPDGSDDRSTEEWLVVDATDGRIIDRALTDTWAAGSHHLAHPDDRQMGLSVGEGQDGAPALWGRLVDGRLSVTRFGDDRCLIAVAPSGNQFVTVSHGGRDELAMHRLPDGRIGAAFASEWLPPADPSPPDRRSFWNFVSGFVDDTTLVAATHGPGYDKQDDLHWFVDTSRVEVHGPVRYPVPVGGVVCGLGDGSWLTTGVDRFQLLRWREVVDATSPELWGRVDGPAASGTGSGTGPMASPGPGQRQT